MAREETASDLEAADRTAQARGQRQRVGGGVDVEGDEDLVQRQVPLVNCRW
jgi:hypothetical protein